MEAQKGRKQVGISIFGVSGHESAFCQCLLISRCPSGANPQLILAPWEAVGLPNWLNLGQGRGQSEAQKSTESGGDYDFWAVRGDVRSFGLNIKLGPGTFKNDGARTGLWAGVA